MPTPSSQLVYGRQNSSLTCFFGHFATIMTTEEVEFVFHDALAAWAAKDRVTLNSRDSSVFPILFTFLVIFQQPRGLEFWNKLDEMQKKATDHFQRYVYAKLSGVVGIRGNQFRGLDFAKPNPGEEIDPSRKVISLITNWHESLQTKRA
jgi:hypothetical protein